VDLDPPASRKVRVSVDELAQAVGYRTALAADIDGNGVFDVRDIEQFEAEYALDGSVSTGIQAVTEDLQPAEATTLNQVESRPLRQSSLGFRR
jgi:hypothetical protein